MSNHWGSYVLLDPADMERMFSFEDALSNLPSINEGISEESLPRLEEVRRLLDQLPPREADFIELYFFQKVRQTAIAELFNVSQPTVCYRLQRGAARLRYLVEMPVVDEDEMEQSLRGFFQEEKDIQIMIGMVRTTCQSDVAKELGVSQGLVRYRFLRAIDKLSVVPGMEQYVKLFQHVCKNLNMLKNTSRANWSESLIYSVC